MARGIAVLGVVLFHSNHGFHLGYLGVNLFFVISGYVTAPSVLNIVRQSDSQQFFVEFMNFIKLRFYRLFPAFFVISVAGLFLITIVSIPEIVKKSASLLMFSPIFLANIAAYKLSNNYFFPQPSGFLHYWSLSVEEQIYILIPITGFVLFRVARFRRFIFPTIGVISFITWLAFEYSKVLSIFGVNDHKGMNYFLLTTYIWQYCVGLLAHISENQLSKRLEKNFKSILWGISSILLLMIIFTHKSLVFIQNTNLIWLLTSLLAFIFLISGSSGMSDIKNFPLNYLFKILQKIGNASYSIYLIHFPILFIFFTSPNTQKYKSNHFVIWCLVLLSILLGMASYREIENRFRRTRTGQLVLPTNKKWILHYLSIALSVILLSFVSMQIGGKYWSKDTPKTGWLLEQKFFDAKAESREIYVLDGVLRTINGRSSNNSILLAGDSHAGALAASLISNFSGKTDLLLKSGCPLALSNYDFSCPGFGESVIAQVRLKEYQVIILTNQFNFNSDNLSSFMTFYSALKSTTSAKIIIIGPVPEILDTPRIGGAFWQNYGGAREFRLDSSRLEPIKVNRELLRVLDSDVYVNAIGLMCPSGVCKLWDPTRGWLYVDQDHLSISGSDILIKKVLSSLGFEESTRFKVYGAQQ